MYIYIYTQSNIDRDRDKNLQPRCGNVVKIKLKRDKRTNIYLSGIYDNNTDASENSDVSSKIEREEGEERQRGSGVV